ncbi:MAG: hypothetical protein HY652_15425 [Acidobacteria bacterium]|nr:hypothetical protein [Acidobacteriota bacterium]
MNALSSLRVFALAWSLYLLTAGGHFYTGDEETLFRVTESLVSGRRGAIDRRWEVVDDRGARTYAFAYGFEGVGGNYYGKYGIGQSLAAVPFYGLGSAASQLLPRYDRRWILRFFVSLTNTLVAAASVAVFFSLARALGCGPRAGLLLALVLGFATPLWVYAKTFLSQPLMLCLLLSSFLAAVRRRPAWAGTLLGCAVLVRFESLLGAPVLLWYGGLSRRRATWGPALWFLIPLALALSGVGAYNVARFGSPLDFGYREEFSSAWYEGLFGLALAPGKSLFLFAPVVLIGMLSLKVFCRVHRREAAALSCLVALLVLFYSTWHEWDGGFIFWGPRYLVPLIPFLLIPIIGRLKQEPPWKGRWKAALVVILFASFAVQALGVVVHWHKALSHSYLELEAAGLTKPEIRRQLLYNPAYSPVLSPFRHWARSDRIPDFWWIKWMELGDAAGYAGFLGMSVLAGSTLFWARSLWKRPWGSSESALVTRILRRAP